MKTIRKLKKRSGFTLVELLIVIIIIGILAGAMMLVAGSGTESAEATKVISDMRGLKAAALMYYADKGGDDVPEVSPDLNAYMDRTVGAGYSVSGDQDSWFILYDVSGRSTSFIDRITKTEGFNKDGDFVSTRAR